jgi:hypothetical protein
MRRTYSTAERRVWNQRYSERKRKLGWVYCSFHVPKNVGASLKKLKCELMARYMEEQTVKGKITIKMKTEPKKQIVFVCRRVD